jgi:transcription factor SPT20 homolog
LSEYISEHINFSIQTILADVNSLTADGDWSNEDKIALESQLVLATSEPLCLDPNPAIGVLAINEQYRRQILNTPSIRRQAKKFSQVSINRKRKTDQFTHVFGLELSDFMQRYRAKPREYPTKNTVNSFTLPKQPSDVVQSIQAPNFELPPELPTPRDINDVEKHAIAYYRPKEDKDCIPQLTEEYIFETDQAGGRIHHIKLSIYQRPSNSEFLGELYVDRDFKAHERNGESCTFSLGTQAFAHRYIRQFTEIFTEEGKLFSLLREIN